jgi:hypothetical protein
MHLNHPPIAIRCAGVQNVKNASSRVFHLDGRPVSVVVRLRLIVLLVGLVSVPHSTTAQGGVFDYWAVDFLSFSWGPIRDDSADAWLPVTLGVSSPGIAVGGEGQVLSVGRMARLLRHRSAVRLRQPIARSDHVLRVGATQDGRSVSGSSGNRFLQTGVVRTLDLDLQLRRPETVLGGWSLLVATSWNSAFSWMAELRNETPFHHLRVSRWRSNPHQLHLTFPTERITDVAEQHQMDGTTISAGVAIPLGAHLRLTGGARTEDGSATEKPMNGESFLTLSPSGSMSNVDVWIGLDHGDTHGVTLKRREKQADLGGDFLRTDLRAGRLFFSRWDFSQWSVTGWRRGGEGEWRLTVGRDQMASELSARLETWPVTEIWEQLGAIAFRYRAGLDGHSMWVRLSRATRFFEWAATVARYEAHANQEDWLVTSLGFGRAEHESTVWDVESLVLTMVEVSRAFPLAAGVLTLHAAAGVPVLGRTNQTPLPTESANTLAGQLNLGVSWAR